MDEVLRMIEIVEDKRQSWKVKHKLLDIVVIVLFAKLANADDWEEIEYCAEYNEEHVASTNYLQNLLKNIRFQGTIRQKIAVAFISSTAIILFRIISTSMNKKKNGQDISA